MPSAWAAMPIRPPSSVASAILKPVPSSPSIWLAATRWPSKASSTVEEVCRPSFGISPSPR